MLMIMGKLENRIPLSTPARSGRLDDSAAARLGPLDLDFAFGWEDDVPAARAVAAAAAALDFDAERGCFWTPPVLDMDVRRGVVLEPGRPGFFLGGAISIKERKNNGRKQMSYPAVLVVNHGGCWRSARLKFHFWLSVSIEISAVAAPRCGVRSGPKASRRPCGVLQAVLMWR
jgi:hypothetical protein